LEAPLYRMDLSDATKNAHPEEFAQQRIGHPMHQEHFDIFFELLRLKRMADCGIIHINQFEVIRAHPFTKIAWGYVMKVMLNAFNGCEDH